MHILLAKVESECDALENKNNYQYTILDLVDQAAIQKYLPFVALPGAIQHLALLLQHQIQIAQMPF